MDRQTRPVVGQTDNSSTIQQQQYWKDEMERLCREDENRALRRQQERIRQQQGEEGLQSWKKQWGRWAEEQ
jgi:hypothetical protein